MTTIDITSHTAVYITVPQYKSQKNTDLQIAIIGDHTKVVLSGSVVPTYTQMYGNTSDNTKFIMMVPNNTQSIKVQYNTENIVKNAIGNTQYVLVEIEIDNDSFVIRFGEDFGIPLIIKSSRSGNTLVGSLKRALSAAQTFSPTDMVGFEFTD